MMNRLMRWKGLEFWGFMILLSVYLYSLEIQPLETHILTFKFYLNSKEFKLKNKEFKESKQLHKISNKKYFRRMSCIKYVVRTSNQKPVQKGNITRKTVCHKS